MRTPRVSGLSDGISRGAQQEGRLASRPVFALHAAGAPQIAHDCSWERGCFSHVEGHKSNSIACSFSPVRPRRRGAFAPVRRSSRTSGRGRREAPTAPAPSAAPARCDGCASAYSATMNGAVARLRLHAIAGASPETVAAGLLELGPSRPPSRRRPSARERRMAPSTSRRGKRRAYCIRQPRAAGDRRRGRSRQASADSVDQA